MMKLYIYHFNYLKYICTEIKIFVIIFERYEKYILNVGLLSYIYFCTVVID